MPYEFTRQRRVAFAETDLAGIVHFSNYFRYMEETEHAFYRSLGLRIHPSEGPGIGWPRVDVQCEYRAPLRFDDVFEVRLLVRQKRRKSVTYAAVFRKLDDARTVVARGTMTVVSVAFDPSTGTMNAVSLPSTFDAQLDVAPPEVLAAADAER